MFKVGDRVIQINKDMSISKIGWVGTVINITSVYSNCIYVMFDNYPTQLDTYPDFLELYKNYKRSYITKKPINKPGKVI